MATLYDDARAQAQNFLQTYNPVPLEKDIQELAMFILFIEVQCLRITANQIDDAMEQSKQNGDDEYVDPKHLALIYQMKDTMTKFLRGKAMNREIVLNTLAHMEPS